MKRSYMKGLTSFRLWFGFVLCTLFLIQSNARGQDKERPSPPAKASFTLNGNEITINYSSPAVKGRAIWGQLVPYDKVWRTGANENTTVTFSKSVMIEGKKLAAGTYGLHSIPSQNDWLIIFSNDSKAWGSFSYKQENDALRITVKPQPSEFQERLSFTIGKENNKARVVLAWEKLKIAFNVENAD